MGRGDSGDGSTGDGSDGRVVRRCMRTTSGGGTGDGRVPCVEMKDVDLFVEVMRLLARKKGGARLSQLALWSGGERYVWLSLRAAFCE